MQCFCVGLCLPLTPFSPLHFPQVTAARAGKQTMSVYFPTTHFDGPDGIRPIYRRDDPAYDYNGHLSFAARVDEVLAWLAKDEFTRPDLVLLYYSGACVRVCVVCECVCLCPALATLSWMVLGRSNVAYLNCYSYPMHGGITRCRPGPPGPPQWTRVRGGGADDAGGRRRARHPGGWHRRT